MNKKHILTISTSIVSSVTLSNYCKDNPNNLSCLWNMDSPAEKIFSWRQELPNNFHNNTNTTALATTTAYSGSLIKLI